MARRLEMDFHERFGKPCEIKSKDVIITIKQAEPKWEVHVSDPLGTGTTVWDAALVLADYLFAHRQVVQGKTVLELGSGTGACGLVAAAVGAVSVCLTDLPYLIPLLEENIRLNSFLLWTSSVRATALTWGAPLPSCMLTAGACAPDVILCADLIYRPEHVDVLLDTLIRVMGPHTKIWWAQEEHDLMSWRRLKREAQARGFTVSCLRRHVDDERAASIDLISLRRASSLPSCPSTLPIVTTAVESQVHLEKHEAAHMSHEEGQAFGGEGQEKDDSTSTPVPGESPDVEMDGSDALVDNDATTTMTTCVQTTTNTRSSASASLANESEAKRQRIL